MKKEIKSKQEITITKDDGPIPIKTTIDNLKTYNEKILKENIYLITPEDHPYDFCIKTEQGINKGFIQIPEDGPQKYTIKKDTVLGHLVKIKDAEIIKIKEETMKKINQKTNTSPKKQSKRQKVLSITPLYIPTEERINPVEYTTKKALQTANVNKRVKKFRRK